MDDAAVDPPAATRALEFSDVRRSLSDLRESEKSRVREAFQAILLEPILGMLSRFPSGGILALSDDERAFVETSLPFIKVIAREELGVLFVLQPQVNESIPRDLYVTPDLTYMGLKLAPVSHSFTLQKGNGICSGTYVSMEWVDDLDKNVRK
jgi:hypothetical protein